MKLNVMTIFIAGMFTLSTQATEVVLAQEDIGKNIPVIQTEKVTVTQVVVGDDSKTYLMTTGQPVKEHVLVTGEMARNAMPYRIALDSLPPIYSDKQVHNAGETKPGKRDGFSKLGNFEPITVVTTDVHKLYFQYGKDIFYVETTGNKPDSLLLDYDLMAIATKIE